MISTVRCLCSKVPILTGISRLNAVPRRLCSEVQGGEERTGGERGEERTGGERGASYLVIMFGL